MKPKTFSELFNEAEQHEDYWVAGAILAFTESVVREMERQGMSRTELAQRLGATPAYVTKILRGKANFTLTTMVQLARALDADLSVQLLAGASRPALQVDGKGEKIAVSQSRGRRSAVTSTLLNIFRNAR